MDVGINKKELIFALLADNWLHQNGDLQTPLAHHIKRQVRDAFFSGHSKLARSSP